MEDWFNEYQEVEDYLIGLLNDLGDDYVNLDFTTCKRASDVTKLIIDTLINKIKKDENKIHQ